MQNSTPNTASKTSWSKQSAALLISIVKDVEQKILRKELAVGKDNEKTKWDYVAESLHEASPCDATKTSNNCQYKFWELNRHFKYLLRESAGKEPAEEKESAIFAALKSYYGDSPPSQKKRRPHRRTSLFKDSRLEPETQLNVENPLQLVIVPTPDNDARYQSEEDSEGSLQNPSPGESALHLNKTTSQAGELSEEDRSAGSPVNQATGDAAGEVPTPQSARSRCKSKRKAGDLQSPGLEEAKQEEKNPHRLKQMLDKMGRLTSYLKWKECGVGEDWRCILTDRIERRQKRSIRTLNNNPSQALEGQEEQVPDEIEAALREDIWSFWNELDRKPPTEVECHGYFLKKCAGEFY